MDYSQIRSTYIDGNGNKIYSRPGFKPGLERIETISSDGVPSTSGSSWVSGYGLVLSLSDIEAIIPQLQNVSSQLKEMWNSSMHSSLARIEDSWAGEDALKYTEKVRALDPRVNKMCQAIDLLAQTYQKVLDRSFATESDVAQKISSINSNY